MFSQNVLDFWGTHLTQIFFICSYDVYGVLKQFMAAALAVVTAPTAAVVAMAAATALATAAVCMRLGGCAKSFEISNFLEKTNNQ